MKKMILNLSLILATIGNAGIAEEKALKECKNEKDKMNGCVEKWYTEDLWGILPVETPYKNGEKNGIETTYYDNGNPRLETPYKNGKIEGIEWRFRPSGDPLESIPYKDGKIDGVRKWYYRLRDNGDLWNEIPYKNEIVDGTAKKYDENGSLELAIPYKNGKKEGIVRQYHKNGKLQATLTYKNDNFISGKYSNGKTLTEDDLSEIKWDINNIDDLSRIGDKSKSEGIAKWYYDNGNLGEETPYKNGRAEGIGKRYHKDGKLQATLIYKDGKLISGKCGDGKALTDDDFSEIFLNMGKINKICKDSRGLKSNGGSVKVRR